MSTLITFASILALATSSAINPNLNAAIKAFETLKNQAQSYADTLPESANEDAKLLVPEIIKKYGYPVEVHTVTTSKGYILEAHRIPYGRNGTSTGRPVVYLQHGLFAASSDFVLSGPEKGLGYILADAGYDVWMPNCRGNRYSRKHVSLDPDKDAKSFWDFSQHELAVEDLPEMIDYVIAKTNQPKIFYIGHSQGTTISYILCSEKPEYNQRFRAIFSLAPVSYMGNMFSPIIRAAAAIRHTLDALFELFGVYEFLPHSESSAKMGPYFCAEDSALQPFCIGAVLALAGPTPDQTNKTLFPILLGHYFAGSATKQVSHYGQLINSDKFRQFDYGLLGNLAKYWSISPPDYKLNKIVAPVYLHYSSNDWLCHTKDVDKLHEELGNSQGKFLISHPKFNHVNLLFGLDVVEVLYKKILKQMENH